METFIPTLWTRHMLESLQLELQLPNKKTEKSDRVNHSRAAKQQQQSWLILQAEELELAVWRGCGWWAAAEYDERPITSSSSQHQGSAAALEPQNRESMAS